MASERPHPMTERPMDASLLTFDLPAVLAQLKREDAWARAPRTGITLLKGQQLRVMLVALHAGTTIPSHQAEGPITVQVIEGTLRFHAEADTLTLQAGQMVTLQGGIPHAVEAVEESAFLLTLAASTPHPAES
jgi:quercetin dioxygenase-like cupin family protein